MHYVDSLVGRVLDDLERRKLLERTVVIVTSDHGMEFDENGQGFTGHGTVFSGYQMHTPLVLRWPGRPPGRVVAANVAQRRRARPCSPSSSAARIRPSDYASGHSLFSEGQWDWLIAASHSDFALIEPERVTIVYPAGYEIRDRNYRLVGRPDAPPRRLAGRACRR